MNKFKIAKLISILSYLFIILAGQMIGVPFFIWLFYTLIDFTNSDQLFALFGVIGLTIAFFTLNSKRTFKMLILDISCFMLLVAPLIRRITAIPIVKFNYMAFIIPTTTFILFYIFSLYFALRQEFQNKKSLA